MNFVLKCYLYPEQIYTLKTCSITPVDIFELKKKKRNNAGIFVTFGLLR